MDPATILLAIAAVLGSAAAVLHMVGWIPPRYRKTLAELQASTARSISEALYGPLVALDSTLKAMDVSKGISQLNEASTNFMDLGNRIQASLAAVPTTLASIPDAVASGFQAVLAQIGSQVNQPPAGDAHRAGIEMKRTAAEVSSFAKIGAKKLALAAAGGFHPAAGAALGIANAMGVIDDATLEKFAEILIDNPELMGRLNAAGQRIQSGRGLTSEGNGGGYRPGIG